MLNELGRRNDKLSENFNEERKTIKNQSEMNYTITEIKKIHQRELTADWLMQNKELVS